MKVPWLQVAPWLILAVLGALWIKHERSDAAFQVEARQAAQIHKQDSVLAVVAMDSAQRSAQKAEQARQAAGRQVRVSEALRRQTDSLAGVSSDERQRAIATLQDSLATQAVLRETVARLVETGRRDSLAYANQRDQDARTIGVLSAALRADSTAIGQGIQAQVALLRRAEASEKEVRQYKAQRPSRVMGYAKIGAAVVATYFIVKR